MIVIKIGGSIVEGLNPTILDDFKELVKNNKVVIVHGGGKDVTDTAHKMGKEQKFIVSPDGKRSRYTDKETAMIYTMVMSGKISKNIAAMLGSQGILSVGITGIDGEMIRAQRKKKLLILNEKGRKMIIEGGYTGKVSKVNPHLVNTLLDNGYIPIISPIALSEEYEFLNIDGDRAAANVAGALNADVVIFITNVNGLLIEDKLVTKLTLDEAKNLLPKIGPGMEKKVLASTEAISIGVKKAIIASGAVQNPIKMALENKDCTVIS
ncbi:[LysW]-aminoadipate/[LysW]-glutamate kinase [Candidatus Nitrosocosmicus hydrocola]|uniref:[LysW]-aminoadipate/[LysW]-glutamate kinase n=1 Tax=Candidatus Nitrosocosmicus hydrocola TaxID=1826872 RepID=UPI0011E5C862|nr:[LysW]-aminoadipate/[LysW]-glutamate kinase [Candidatus Nitrosocosmicus hydrocola]